MRRKFSQIRCGMVERAHYLEVGGDEIPARDASAGAIEPQAAEESVQPFSDTDFESETRASFVGVDFRGDRPDSGWQSIGERLAQMFWYTVAIVAIIVIYAIRVIRQI